MSVETDLFFEVSHRNSFIVPSRDKRLLRFIGFVGDGIGFLSILVHESTPKP